MEDRRLNKVNQIVGPCKDLKPTVYKQAIAKSKAELQKLHELSKLFICQLSTEIVYDFDYTSIIMTDN